MPATAAAPQDTFSFTRLANLTTAAKMPAGVERGLVLTKE
jgi:hypothetical protein